MIANPAKSETRRISISSRFLARFLLIVVATAATWSSRAEAQSRTFSASVDAWSPGTAYNLNEIVLSSGAYYISLSANNMGNPPASSPTKWIALGGDGDISVRRFGAVGDGTADDSSALQNALTWMGMSGGCVYLPQGAYKTTSELDWVNQYAAFRAKPLCLRGDGWARSYLVYMGSSKIDAAIHVYNTSGAPVAPSVDISNFGIAANANASYALHVITPGPSTMDNVAFAGGSLSSFEGDGWNGIADLRNLHVGRQFFAPAGSTPCVNGLTFSHGVDPVAGQDIPSSQFTLTAPQAVGCTGIGLNFASAMGITINGGQSSGNKQDLYRANPSGQPQPFIINGMLLETNPGYSPTPMADEVLGGFAILNGIQFNSKPLGLQLSGIQNVVVSSTGIFTVLSGSVNTQFVNNLIYTGSTDAGTGTYGSGNLQEAGGNAPLPWNGLPMVQVRYANALPSGTDLYSLTACGIYSVINPMHGPAALAAMESRVQVLCDQSANTTSRTLIAQGIRGPGSNNIYIDTESNGTWQGWQQFQLSGDLVTGYPTAPSGPCTVVGWIFSQDGRATFCNGTNWVAKI
jgi:hypothetical protein